MVYHRMATSKQTFETHLSRLYSNLMTSYTGLVEVTANVKRHHSNQYKHRCIRVSNRWATISKSTHLVLRLLLVRQEHLLEPLVRNRQTVRVSHVHHSLEEAALLRSAMVEEDQRVLNGDNAIIHALDKSAQSSLSSHQDHRAKLTFSSNSRQFGWSMTPVSTRENFFCAFFSKSSTLS